MGNWAYENKPQCCPLCKVIESGFCQITGQNFLVQFDRLVSEYVNQWVVLDLCGHSQRTSDKVNLTKGDFLFLWCGKYRLGRKGPISARVYRKKYSLGCQESLLWWAISIFLSYICQLLLGFQYERVQTHGYIHFATFRNSYRSLTEFMLIKGETWQRPKEEK